MTDEQIILADMKAGPSAQSSWDWPADMRFAKALGATEEILILEALLKSTAVFKIQIAVHRAHITHLKNRRLKALRSLEKQGIVESWWIGTGPGGLNEFGVGRTKNWILVSK